MEPPASSVTTVVSPPGKDSDPNSAPSLTTASAAPISLPRSPSSPLAARPIIVFTLAFTLGDGVGLSVPSVTVVPFGAAVFAILVIRLLNRCNALTWKGRTLWRAATLFFCLGLLRGSLALIPGAQDISLYARGMRVIVAGRVVGEAIRHGDGWSATVEAENETDRGGKAEPATGRAVLWVRDPPGSDQSQAQLLLPPFEVGDRIVGSGILERTSGPRNPGGFNSGAYQSARSIHAILTVRRRSDVQIVRSAAGRGLSAVAASARNSFEGAMRGLLTPENASVVSGIVFGARSQLPGRLQDDFSVTGTAHILATAGLHVGIVAFLLLRLSRTLRLSRRGAAVASILCLVLYALASGGRPAVVRAVLMATFYLGALLFDREPDGTSSLAAAALTLLAWSPALLLDAGFQLSFVTVAAIIAFFQVLSDVHPRAEEYASDKSRSMRERFAARAISYVSTLLLVSLAAQLGAAPLTAHYFHLVSTISLVANLLVVPIVALILPLSLLLWPLALLAPSMAQSVARGTLDPLVDMLIAIVESLAHVPGAAWSTASPGLAIVSLLYAAYFGTLYTAGLLLRRRKSGFTPHGKRGAHLDV